MKRIDIDNLEFGDDDEFLLDGKPFTGIGYSKYKNGQLRGELHYQDGYPLGLCRKWYENGQLAKEWIAERGVAPARTTEWYDSGQLKSQCIRECGVDLEYTEWDRDGKVLSTKELEEGSIWYEILLKRREIKADRNK